METFINYLLGDQSPLHFLGLIFFALLAALLSLLLHTTSRDVEGDNKPVEFSWRFLWCDNIKRIVSTLILIFVCIRFTPQFFGIQITEFFAFIIGFVNDKLAQIVKDYASAFTKEKRKRPS
jgi:hypothetical protein